MKVDNLTRVEGEGALYVEVRDGQVRDVQLRIFEPPRFFEAFLRGRAYTEPADITARICGICPVAYQMSACRAIEAACGIELDGPLRDLRRLLYTGEWIESHTLHIVMLHAPDFLGYPNAIALATDHRDAVERGLLLKKAGNDLLDLVGGRAVHPVNVRVGGFYRAPGRRELRAFRPRLEEARDRAIDLTRWVAGFDFPDAGHDYHAVALRHPTDYAVLDGRVVSNQGLDVADGDFGLEFTETHVPHSTALHSHLTTGDHYLVGPLARWWINNDRMGGVAAEVADEVGLERPCRNPFRSILVRAVEVVHACDEAIRIIDAYEEPDAPAVAVEPRAGTGAACTEAPRGLLYHRYTLDDDGTILDATIVPPTSQNQPTIEHDLWHLVEDPLVDGQFSLGHDELTHRCEQAIRNHDPCISCATHFLDLVVDEA
jgi:sulfhydrogenase subunit alpha